MDLLEFTNEPVVNMIVNLEQMWRRPYLRDVREYIRSSPCLPTSKYHIYLGDGLLYLLICKDEHIHFFMQ